MKITILFLTGLLSTLLLAAAAHADRFLKDSSQLLVAANNDVYVIHEHQVDFDIDDPKAREMGTIVAHAKSVLRIFSRREGREIFKQFVMSLTALINIDGSEYFAGLSHLKTLSFQYNFILFDQDGRFVAKALVTPTSEHCRAAAFSVTNAILWFDNESPQVRLEFDNDRPVRAIVKNPYDVSPNGEIGECVIRIEGSTTDSWPLPTD